MRSRGTIRVFDGSPGEAMTAMPELLTETPVFTETQGFRLNTGSVPLAR
jgi:hypothetical protein